ncbi:MAG: hypothetical protein ACFFEU_11920 [Candidatus Thorarchaeota archaeon]
MENVISATAWDSGDELPLDMKRIVVTIIGVIVGILVVLLIAFWI